MVIRVPKCVNKLDKIEVLDIICDLYEGNFTFIDSQSSINDQTQKSDNSSLVELAKGLANGTINLYGMVRDENDKIVGTKRIFLEENLKDRRLELLISKIETKIDIIEKKCGYRERRKLKRKLEFYREIYNDLLNSPYYKSSIKNSEEIESYDESVQRYLTEIFSDEKIYNMKKTD